MRDPSEFIQEWPEGKLTQAQAQALFDVCFEYETKHNGHLSDEYEAARDKLAAAIWPDG